MEILMFVSIKKCRTLLTVLTVVALLVTQSALAEQPSDGAVASSASPQPSRIIDQIKDRVMRMAAGADVQLGGSREPAIAVDPNNPNRVAYASLWESRVSTDGGDTWTAAVGSAVDAGQGQCGDPSIVFDS
jgi:hypothetical protein